MMIEDTNGGWGWREQELADSISMGIKKTSWELRYSGLLHRQQW